MKIYRKFGSLIAVILGTLSWLAMGGTSETKMHYKTIAELTSWMTAARIRGCAWAVTSGIRSIVRGTKCGSL